MAVALFSLQVYDRVIPHQSTATLWVLAIGAGLAMLLEAFLRIARARLMDGAGRRIELKVQALLMDRLLGMKRGLGQTPSGLFSAVREFSSVREFFTASTIGTLTDLPFIVLFLALVAAIGGHVVWVLFVGAVLMVLPGFFLQKRMIALTQQTQGASVKSNKLLHEVIYEADTIKAQRGEDRFKRLWSELSAVSSLATSEQRKLASTLTFWAQGVQQATYVAAVVAGTFLVFTGQFTVGTIIAVGILTSRTLGPLTQLAATLARWSNVKAALEALDTVALAEQDQAEDRTYLRRDTLRGAFELREIAFTYDEDSGQTLDIPGLKITPGQRIAVLGPNGSGKSTLLKLLSGIYRPSRGRVLIDGVDMGQVMPRDLRRSIGYLGQEVRLFSGTLRENLNLTLLERDDDRLLAALDFAGLGPFVRGHPKGLDLPISDGGEGLSIGQRQSIGWARLWLQDPVVCLLDEPTAALDQTLESTLVDRLGTWLQGRTAVIATHRLPILQLADRTLILQSGPAGRRRPARRGAGPSAIPTQAGRLMATIEQEFESRSRGPSLIIWLVGASVLLFLVWARFATLDEIIRAPGQVVSGARPQIIQNLEGGILAELAVSEGDRVAPGDVIARLDATQFETGMLELRDQIIGRRGAPPAARGRDGRDVRFRGRPGARGRQPRHRRLGTRIAGRAPGRLRQPHRGRPGHRRRNRPRTGGDGGSACPRPGRPDRGDPRPQCPYRCAERAERDRYPGRTGPRRGAFRNAAADRHAAPGHPPGRGPVAPHHDHRAGWPGPSIRSRSRRSAAWSAREKRSPRSPPLDDALNVEARVRPADIAGVVPGQAATVKFTAYDYTIYGTIPGEVALISADTFRDETDPRAEPHYRVTVRVDTADLDARQSQIDLRPGLVADVELHTGQKTVLDYLTKPLTRGSEALREP